MCIALNFVLSGRSRIMLSNRGPPIRRSLVLIGCRWTRGYQCIDYHNVFTDFSYPLEKREHIWSVEMVKNAQAQNYIKRTVPGRAEITNIILKEFQFLQ